MKEEPLVVLKVEVKVEPLTIPKAEVNATEVSILPKDDVGDVDVKLGQNFIDAQIYIGGCIAYTSCCPTKNLPHCGS